MTRVERAVRLRPRLVVGLDAHGAVVGLRLGARIRSVAVLGHRGGEGAGGDVAVDRIMRGATEASHLMFARDGKLPRGRRPGSQGPPRKRSHNEPMTASPETATHRVLVVDDEPNI